MYQVKQGGIPDKDRHILVLAAGELSVYAELLNEQKIPKRRLNEAFDEILLVGNAAMEPLFELCTHKDTSSKDLETTNFSQPNMAFGQYRKNIRRQHGELRNTKTVVVMDADRNKLLVRANLKTWDVTVMVNDQIVEYVPKNYNHILAIYLNMAVCATLAAPEILLT